MPLHIDYRPNDFDQVIGNTSTIKSMLTILERENKDFPHAIMLHGPRGTGKTTLAYIWAKHLGCPPEIKKGETNIDFREIDTAQQTGVDTARDIRGEIRYRPINSDVRVYLLDECHKMSPAFQNGMLKATEKPPSFVYFILCTTEPNKIIPTLTSRCMKFATEKASDIDLQNLALDIFESEGLINISSDILNALVKSADGAPRELLINMDKILDLDPDEMMEAIIQVDQQQVIDLCRALIKKQPWSAIAQILQGIKDNPEQVRLAVMGYMSTVLLNNDRLDSHALLIMNCFKDPNFNNGKPGLVTACAEVYI
ncbi:hypothetical protein LCGC14_0569500 [marine sediment metagenome]|uniref:AAA+ ATPase domain-containing protein n=1 Tax=marine sediment metagenome TaxID=412755 RepID=A0A0F9U5Z5_9ZZZZ